MQPGSRPEPPAAGESQDCNYTAFRVYFNRICIFMAETGEGRKGESCLCNFWKKCAAALLAAVLLSGCGAAGVPSASASSLSAAPPAASTPAPTSQPTPGGYLFPAFHGSAFHADAAQGENGVQIDLSCAAEGYVAVSAVADSRLKFQALAGDMTYTYDLARDGTPSVYPLNCGSGTYELRVMQNVEDSQYVALYDMTAEVALSSEFAPFLCPSQIVNYNAQSACVAKVRQLAQSCRTDADVVNAVYAYLTKNVVYDYDKADSVQKGYLPDPDDTLASGKGICFDYAALAAAMLRAAGVPTRLMTGYVGEIYHAWNEVYLENEGWISVEIQVSPNQWQRIDTTFAASGVEPSFLTNNANYVTRYIY
jgi:hypothetical protein